MANIGKKIDAVRGDLTYAEFSEAIERKTGVSIHLATLQKYVANARHPSQKNLEAIAKYAGVPVAWFYATSDSELDKLASPYAPFDPETLPPRWKQLWEEMMVVFRKPNSDLTNEQAAAVLQIMRAFREQNDQRRRRQPRRAKDEER